MMLRVVVVVVFTEEQALKGEGIGSRENAKWTCEMFDRRRNREQQIRTYYSARY